ncbi:MAG: hypothetical protein ACFWTJ_10040 [Lachnoclostridium sp.]
MNKIFNNNRNSKGDDKMAVLAKPQHIAFELDSSKINEFLEASKKNNINDVISRFQSHKPKKGVNVPFKK